MGSFLFGDDTGLIRIVCWNDKTDFISKLEEQMPIKIEGGYARENRDGRKEVHVADRGNINLDPEEEVPVFENKAPQKSRKKISELGENESNVEILGTIVQAFDPRFFEVCSECGKRMRPKDNGLACEEHGAKEPDYAYVMNLFVDDGTENIRVVLWRNQVQNLLDKNHEDLVAMRTASFEEIKNELLGQIVKFTGRTTKNEMFDRVEFIAQLVFMNPDPKEELSRLEEEKENKEEVQEETVQVKKEIKVYI